MNYWMMECKDLPKESLYKRFIRFMTEKGEF